MTELIVGRIISFIFPLLGTLLARYIVVGKRLSRIPSILFGITIPALLISMGFIVGVIPSKMNTYWVIEDALITKEGQVFNKFSELVGKVWISDLIDTKELQGLQVFAAITNWGLFILGGLIGANLKIKKKK